MSRESCGVVSLEANRLNAFHTEARERIRCIEGVIWLTLDGIARDFVLEAGESLELDPGADVTISAIAPSRFQWSPPLAVARPEGMFSRMAHEFGATLKAIA